MTSRRKIMLVTGGSRGIGRAVVELAIEQNYAVCINYAQAAEEAESLVKQAEQAGTEAIAVKADVSDKQQTDRLFEQIDTRFGQLDVLVNNAGIVGKASRLHDISEARLQNIVGVNIAGAVYCAAAAVRRMSTAQGGSGGSIVNVSSIAAQLGGPNEYVDYAMTKGALDSMTTGLAKEVATEGIRVNAVRPGLIYTDIHASGGEPGRVDRLAHLVPMQRGGTAMEVARAILSVSYTHLTLPTTPYV